LIRADVPTDPDPPVEFGKINMPARSKSPAASSSPRRAAPANQLPAPGAFGADVVTAPSHLAEMIKSVPTRLDSGIGQRRALRAD
jgi:hypothetical protein